MQRIHALERHIRDSQRKGKIPGLSIGLAIRGRPVLRRGYGYRSRETKLPATPRTIYGVASITKVFTALAVLHLEEAGALRIVDPLRRLLPEFATPEPRWTRRITLHHLLTHTSGLPPLPSLYYASARSLAREPPFDPRVARRVGIDPAHAPIDTYEELMRYLATERYRLLGPPGRYFSYSNEGYGLLGAAIERASGQSYESYVEEHVLRPCGMNRTTFDSGIMFRFAEVTRLYSPKWEGRRHPLVAYEDWWDAPCLRASGDLRSNVDDLLGFCRIFHTLGRVGNERVVSPASVNRLVRPHVLVAPGMGYGYGVGIVPDFHGTPLILHTGGLKGVSSAFAVLPKHGISGVVLANAEQAPSLPILVGGINHLRGVPWNTPLLDIPTRAGKPTDPRPYAGWYCSGEGIWMELTTRKRGLRLDFRGIEMIGRGIRFRPNGPDEFVARVGGEKWPLRFARDRAGRIWAVRFGWRLVRRRSLAELRRARASRIVW